MYRQYDTGPSRVYCYIWCSEEGSGQGDCTHIQVYQTQQRPLRQPSCLSSPLLARFCFHRRLFVCLFVCMQNDYKKLWADFHEIWGVGRLLWIREELIKFGKVRARVSALWRDVRFTKYRLVLCNGFLLPAVMCRLKSQQRVIRLLNDYRHR